MLGVLAADSESGTVYPLLQANAHRLAAFAPNSVQNLLPASGLSAQFFTPQRKRAMKYLGNVVCRILQRIRSQHLCLGRAGVEDYHIEHFFSYPRNFFIYSLDVCLGTTVVSQGLCLDWPSPPELKNACRPACMD